MTDDSGTDDTDTATSEPQPNDMDKDMPMTWPFVVMMLGGMVLAGWLAYLVYRLMLVDLG